MASSCIRTHSSALILGHSFVKRLKNDILKQFDARTSFNFDLQSQVAVHMFGIGGRTVDKVRAYDLPVVAKLEPDIIILELGTNDLTCFRPEVVGSKIVDLVSYLLETFSVRVIGVCLVIPRGKSSTDASMFNRSVSIFNQYIKVVFEDYTNVFCWSHDSLMKPESYLLDDDVHLNSYGQYKLYRSYRGAILKAMKL